MPLARLSLAVDVPLSRRSNAAHVPRECRSRAVHAPLAFRSRAARPPLTCRWHAVGMALARRSHAAHVLLTCRPRSCAAHTPLMLCRHAADVPLATGVRTGRVRTHARSERVLVCGKWWTSCFLPQASASSIATEDAVVPRGTHTRNRFRAKRFVTPAGCERPRKKTTPLDRFSRATSPSCTPQTEPRKGHGRAVDWYSIGALTYEMLTGLPCVSWGAALSGALHAQRTPQKSGAGVVRRLSRPRALGARPH